jgi:hypothetical protein
MSSAGVVLATCAALAHAKPYHHEHPGFFDARQLLSDTPADRATERYRRAQKLLRSASATGVPAPTTAIKPTDFGADPTGETISSGAFNKSVAALLALARPDRVDSFGLFDLGGATLDLGGGVYRISEPVAIPGGYSNFKVRSGTLVASSTFRDANGSLLTVGVGSRGCDAPGEPGIKAGTCNRLVDVSHMTLDAGRYAYGGLLINHTMDVNVGPAIMVVGYTGAGIELPGSGATFVQHAWLGAIAPGSPTPRAQATGTGIVLDHTQHDAMVEDIIIFSGMTGVFSTNGANRLSGIHAWNLAGADGGVGIDLAPPWWQKKGVSGGRVQNCYLDYAPLVVRNPGNLVITDNLFLGSSTIVLAAQTEHFEVAQPHRHLHLRLGPPTPSLTPPPPPPLVVWRRRCAT